MNKITESVTEFATVAFTLLGVLFGMMIMTFIFGLLGTGNVLDSTDTLATVTNETGSWLNETTYTVDNSDSKGFGNLIITSAINTTDNSSIGTGNFSVSGAGFTNATVTTWPSIWVSYTYTRDSDAKNAADNVQNNSLNAIIAYTGQSDTQLLTVAIAITLVVLIAVFLLFWMVFIGKKGSKSKMSGGNFG